MIVYVCLRVSVFMIYNRPLTLYMQLGQWVAAVPFVIFFPASQVLWSPVEQS